MERGREDGSRIGRRNRSRSRRGDKRQDVEIGPRRVRVGAVVQWCSAGGGGEWGEQKSWKARGGVDKAKRRSWRLFIRPQPQALYRDPQLT